MYSWRLQYQTMVRQLQVLKEIVQAKLGLSCYRNFVYCFSRSLKSSRCLTILFHPAIGLDEG